MRVLVATVVHTPLDARIHGRQLRALDEAGVEVTYLAPWSGYRIDPDSGYEHVRTIDVPRAVGRNRLRALRAARRLLRQHARDHDVVLLHDPELLLVVAGLDTGDAVVVWDVHEDTGAALVDKPWLPAWARPVVARGVAAVEARAQRNLRLLLAEERYADRLTGGPGGPHPVVPNTPIVPDEPPAGPTDPPRAVHVGRLSVGRGVHELLGLGAALRGEVEVHLIGTPDTDVADAVVAAHDRGEVVHHGFVPNDRALAMVEGAVCGLALLRDWPNYRHSVPTKVYEYLGRAVPVVTTPLAEPAAVVRAADAGKVVPFEDATAAAVAVRALAADPERVRAAGVRGHAHVRSQHAWNVDGPRFVEVLRRWVAAGSADA